MRRRLSPILAALAFLALGADRASAQGPEAQAATPSETTPAPAGEAQPAPDPTGQAPTAAPEPAAATPEPPATPAPPPAPAPAPPVPAAKAEPPPPPEPTAAPTTPEAAAPSGPSIKPLVSMFSRFEAREKYGAIGRADSDLIRYRARFGLQTSPIDIGAGQSVVVRFVPQAGGFWHVGGDTLDDAELNLHEGVLQWHGAQHRLDVGRFEMVYGEHLVLGNVDWHHNGRSFDGARLHAEPGGGVWLDFFFTVLNEGGVATGTDPTAADVIDFIEEFDATGSVTMPVAAQDPIGAGDDNLIGAYLGLGELFEAGADIDLYFLGKLSPTSEDPTTGTETGATYRLTTGARFKGRSDVVDYRLEAGLQNGEAPGNVDAIAYQGDLEVGLNADSDRFRVGLEGLIASGDDPSTADKDEGWDQLYPTAHKWLGFSDIIGGRTNVASGVLHLRYDLASAWRLSLDGHLFVRPEPATVGGADGYAASEIDAGARYAIGTGLNLRGNYSLFIPNSDLYGRSAPVHFVELELRYDLK